MLSWSQLTDWFEYYRQKNGDESNELGKPIDMDASLALLDRMKNRQQTAV